MKLHFFGAAREVTGTCYLLETGSHRILIDCGIFQGGDHDSERNHLPFPFKPSEIDALFITHPHMDHVGRVPQLVKRGYRGPIFTTPPCGELAQLLWKDMLAVMGDALKRDDIDPLYDEHDVGRAAEKVEAVEYGEAVEICAGAVKAIFHDAGHVLGSAFIELRIEGKPQCHIVALAKQQGQIAASVGCALSRARTCRCTWPCPGWQLHGAASRARTCGVSVELFGVPRFQPR